MANWDPELYTEVKAPPTVTFETKPDDKVRRYFPSLDALVHEMNGRTAKEYVKSLRDAGDQVQRVPEDDTKLDTLINSMSRTSAYCAGVTSTFRSLQRESGSDCIQTDTALYTYHHDLAGDNFFLRTEPSTQDPNGPCAIVYQFEDRNDSPIFYDPTSTRLFYEFTEYVDYYTSRLICADDFNHLYTGGSYFFQSTI